MIVAIEGMDAAGKATHSRLLAEKLGGKRFAFPDYDTPTGAVILSHLKRGWQCVGDLMEKNKDDTWDLKVGGIPLDPLVFQCLQTVNRFEVLPLINAAIECGPVVFDRYYASALVYGGLDGLDRDWIELTQAPLPEPDVWILLDISVDEGFKRRPERRDRYEQNRGFLEQVRVAYLRLFSEKQLEWSKNTAGYRARGAVGEFPKWHVVQGLGTVEEVQERILAVLP